MGKLGRAGQGLYKVDEREGPGIVTYTDGQQDVGLWLAEKIIKFCLPVSGAFSIKSHPELEYKEEDKCVYINITEEKHPDESIDLILHPLPPLDYPPQSDLSQKNFSELHSCLGYRGKDKGLECHTGNDGTSRNTSANIWLANQWLEFDVNSVLKLDRRKFKQGSTGASISGTNHSCHGWGCKKKWESLLASGKVHILMFVIAFRSYSTYWCNYVNSLNDEGNSALSAGCILHPNRRVWPPKMMMGIQHITDDDGEETAEAMPGENQENNKSFEDFDSNQSIRNYQIEVSEELVERCATQLSQNELIIKREDSELVEDKARKLAVQINFNEKMKYTLDLLLRRGADPNASTIPMPVLFFAIKSGDVEMVRQLLMKGANPNTRLSKEQGELSPLHIACAIPGEEGVEMTELLLDALADPDARAADDDSFLNKSLEEEWSKDPISIESKNLLGGRTALHIACARDDIYKNSSRVIRLLLEHKASTSLICNGFSPLALAIASGNDLAVDELLSFGADPSQPLTHGVGSALCVANNPEFEHRRTIQARVQLVDKLIKAGADILSPVAIGPKRIIGTAVDYAYYMFNQVKYLY
ncbi:Ankyrin repeat and MYND domain-containing protein 1 [Bulinus truncatus]|nr:Ankyrin repeat and MYND domain-containing protein 1 [Bulinus truncatus]